MSAGAAPRGRKPRSSDLLRVGEAARVAGLSEHAMRRRIACGAVPVLRPGPKSTRVRRRDAERLREVEGLLVAEDVAGELRVAVETVWAWTREGRLPHVKHGRGYRYRREDLDAFLAAAEEPADPAA